MEYFDNFNSDSLYLPLINGDSEPPIFFNNDEDLLESMEEFFSTLPPSWFEDADALLYNGKDIDIDADVSVVNIDISDPVGDLSMPVPESSVSPEPYYSNIDIGYPPMPDPKLTASPESYDHSIEAGYPSMPIPELTVSPEPIDYKLSPHFWYI
ncbi:hypothetical protein Clacol_009433 [Clathrus columnatus]|uniref:Uncharacterized protein n=1 Tax=Clathrus columnatus TaxID=1419009 RepID=A0AAV5AQ37_9AGAM|nr:hypothetical protein Clacol_009433 [Clathrus columnatus]